MSRLRPITLALMVLLALLLALPQAWGQLYRPKRSGAGSSGRIIHLKDVERMIFRLTNNARRKNGLAALDPDETLTAMARQHSDDMLKRDFFSHTSPDGKTVKDRLFNAPAVGKSMSQIGENIYGGSGHDYSDSKVMARMIVDGWMTSPGHRANILNPHYTHLGVGVGVLGKEIRATQNFATRQSP